MGQKSPLFYRRQSGGMFSVVDETKITGDIWFADSGSATGADAAGYGQNPDKPFLTWDYAIGQATANQGDVIFLMPGHAETLTTAGDVALDKAGITTIGIGEGADRPTFTFSSTDNSASVLITAASNKVKNIIGVCGDNGMTNPFHVQAADCELDITWRDPANVEAATCILTTAAAARLKIRLKYEGDVATGDACVAPITLIGIEVADIYVDFYGIASTAVIDMKTTASNGIVARGYFYNSGTTDMSKNMKATIGGGKWFVEGYDGAAGQKFSGGSAATVAGDDVATVSSKATSVGTLTSKTVSTGTIVSSKATSIGTRVSTAISTGTITGSKATSIGTALASKFTSFATFCSTRFSLIDSQVT